MTYLEMCQEFVSDHGIAGDGLPATVLNQKGDLKNVVRWIRDANTYIENLWLDWRFLWAEHRVSLSTGDDQPDLPAFTVRLWHRKTFALDRDGDRKPLEFVPWKDFTLDFSKPKHPSRITERPDGVLKLDAPLTQAREFYGECQKEPIPLAQNSDVPLMPVGFHRLIRVRAAIMYGNAEDAPEIISGAESEYIDLLEKLEAAQLPGGVRATRLSTSDETDLDAEVGCIPGF